ncbi:hypothetical protein DICVIV_12446, partial [Dictyocaulus viviparus]
ASFLVSGSPSYHCFCAASKCCPVIPVISRIAPALLCKYLVHVRNFASNKQCSKRQVSDVNTTIARSDGVFDVPSCVESRTDDVTSRVRAVAREWRWAMVDPKSFAVIIPVDQDPKSISRERFVSLLEYCEEELGKCS